MMSPPGNLTSVIERARQNLLDLSLRNRLLNTPRGFSRSKRLDIVEERCDDVFELLVGQQRTFTFLPTADPEKEEADSETEDADYSESLPEALEQPEAEQSEQPDLAVHEQPSEEQGEHPEEEPDEQSDSEANAEVATRNEQYRDTRLQTLLAAEALQTRLLSLYYDARTFEEEQGVSILYLAMGFLQWHEAGASDKPRYAPLLLVPVDLDRTSVSAKFKLTYRESDIGANLSLQAKLRAEFNIAIPDVPDVDDLVPSDYFAKVEEAIAGKQGWRVLRDDMVLWFFSFAKYLMYRDLDSATWPEHAPLTSNAILAGLLGEGFPSEPPLCDEDDKIDGVIPLPRMIHVTDADSSQALVIEEVRQGRSLVVQGPPGTGKSQTITNLIAASIKEGKKVLFVAEKMAALEVVKSRLDRLGLGAICLELHSHKANKKGVVDELARTVELGRPRAIGAAEHLQTLQSLRDLLNRHAAAMNTPLQPAGATPFEIMGRLAARYTQGARPVEFRLSDPLTWSKAQFEEKRRLVTDLAVHLRGIGIPSQHPWRGVGVEAPILPTELRTLLDSAAEVHTSLVQLEAAAARELVSKLQEDQLEIKSLQHVVQLVELGRALVAAPPMDRSAMGNAAWEIQQPRLAELVQVGQRMQAARSELSGVVSDVAWETDLTAARRSLAAHGRSWFRFFRGEYRQAIAAVRGVLQADLPRGFDERLKLVDTILQVRADCQTIDSQATLGREAFGSLWNGAASDWSALGRIMDWEQRGRDAGLPGSFRQVMSRCERPDALAKPVEELAARLRKVIESLERIATALRLDLPVAFGQADLHGVELTQLGERLAAWQTAPEAMARWIGYFIRKSALERDGLAELIAAIHEGRLAGEASVEQFQQAYDEALVKQAFAQIPALAAFDGQSHVALIAEFRKLDQQWIDLARREVAMAHFTGVPRESNLGEMAIVRHEMAKKRRILPIRQLLKEAGHAVQAIKPVFMMSPISVAQFLEPGVLNFDLLLMDEASQVTPEDALGAMARATQIVVVGDSKQLPPTRFFSKLLDEGDAAENGEEVFNTGNLDSVLGLCVSQGLAQRMLRWHYRSRHHSLIAVSNREFYENKLHVVPSPTTDTAESGLRFRHIREGTFDRGATATNRAEAKAIAEAVVEHARNHPRKSLGVGTFSVSQRDAVRDEVETLLRQQSDVEEFFAPGNAEPFFIKNLENIQGDERDVIFISVGYARDKSGSLTMNFGPLSVEGGERRLNVLISRARERLEVFSSIGAEDIDLGRAKSRGAAALKLFLRYAATGLLEEKTSVREEIGSPLARLILAALKEHGHDADCQVGTAGFLIDLAIIDADRPGSYLLGIELDGPTYNSSRWARDRDRIREQVLRDRGWRLHRVWSADWLHRPDEQLKKLLKAVEQARLDADAEEAEEREAEEARKAASVIVPESIEREELSADIPGSECGVVPYREANFKVAAKPAIPDLTTLKLAAIVGKVVAIEGPIHREEIARRLASLWKQQRVGNRMAEAISAAIEFAVRSHSLADDEGFISVADQAFVPVRRRDSVVSAWLKKPENLPPAEVREATRRIVAAHLGIEREDVSSAVARLFGFRIASSKLREMVERELAWLLMNGQVTEQNGRLYIAEAKVKSS